MRLRRGKCQIDLAGYERDICDHYSLYRLDLTHRDDKFAGLGKVNDSPTQTTTYSAVATGSGGSSQP
jgi:hypothetical protein